jgi:hypothetical protein
MAKISLIKHSRCFFICVPFFLRGYMCAFKVSSSSRLTVQRDIRNKSSRFRNNLVRSLIYRRLSCNAPPAAATIVMKVMPHESSPHESIPQVLSPIDVISMEPWRTSRMQLHVHALHTIFRTCSSTRHNATPTDQENRRSSAHMLI